MFRCLFIGMTVVRLHIQGLLPLQGEGSTEQQLHVTVSAYWYDGVTVTESGCVTITGRGRTEQQSCYCLLV